MHVSNEKTGLYGLMAEFDSAQSIVDASTKAVAAGYTKLEAYTPFPIEELNDIIHKRRTNLPKAVLFMAFCGMATGFTLQYWASAIEYPLMIRWGTAYRLAAACPIVDGQSGRPAFGVLVIHRLRQIGWLIERINIPFRRVTWSALRDQNRSTAGRSGFEMNFRPL